MKFLDLSAPWWKMIQETHTHTLTHDINFLQSDTYTLRVSEDHHIKIIASKKAIEKKN